MKNIRIETHGDGTFEIFLYGDVGPGWFEGFTDLDVRNALKEFGHAPAIDVHINSQGGDFFHGVTIYNQLRNHDATINIIVDGLAASAASVIAMAGDTIEMRQGSRMMIHDPWTIAMGGADKLRKVATQLEVTTTDLINIYELRTGRTSEDIAAMMAAETYFTATEAVQNGFATSTVAAPAIAACGGEWRAHVPGFPVFPETTEGVKTFDKGPTEPEPAPKPKLNALEKALTMARKAT